MSRNFSSKTPLAPTGRRSLRKLMGKRIDWLFPDTPHRDQSAPPGGIMLCPSCHAIYEDKHLKYDEDRYQCLAQNPEIQQSICEGCDRVNREMFEGIVQLRSPFVQTHLDEILQRIRHEEERARQVNPVARVGLIRQEGDKLMVWTTTGWLAKRIGREVEKAFHGVMKYHRLPGIPFVRVVWTREE
ncbi:MAG TPA: hypothetical protein DD435_14470 [Cyanobacteria bacterium UBA8530]|nr:hypothetical protein [Cyanobacteria bacterium UBA8530]